jgi:hypothetical protein
MVKTSSVMEMAKTPSEKPMMRLLTRLRTSLAWFAKLEWRVSFIPLRIVPAWGQARLRKVR